MSYPPLPPPPHPKLLRESSAEAHDTHFYYTSCTRYILVLREEVATEHHQFRVVAKDAQTQTQSQSQNQSLQGKTKNRINRAIEPDFLPYVHQFLKCRRLRCTK